MKSGYITNIGEPTAREMAPFVLSRILKDRFSVDQMAEELDNNERLVSEIIYFFIDMGWIKHFNGTYLITTKCRNIMERQERNSYRK